MNEDVALRKPSRVGKENPNSCPPSVQRQGSELGMSPRPRCLKDWIVVLAFWIVFAPPTLWGQSHSSGFNVHWAHSASGLGDQQANGVAVDAFGQVHVAGHFVGTTQFETTTVTNAGQFDFYIARYSRNGDLLWVRTGGGPLQDSILSVAADPSGNTLVTGYFNAGARFDGKLLPHTNSADVFVAKLNPAGALIWVTTLGSSGDDRGYGLATDELGNSYVTGHFQSGASVGGIVLTNAGGVDMFLLKLDPDGNPLWARSAGGIGVDVGLAVAVSPKSDVLVSGYLGDQATFEQVVVQTVGNVDLFVAQYDSDGRFKWVRSAGGAEQDYAYSIAGDLEGAAWITGTIRGEVLLGTNLLSGVGQRSVAAKFERDGTLAWARQFPCNESRGVVCFEDGAYLTGHFLGSISLDSNSLTSNGNLDIFVARMERKGAFEWARSLGGTNLDYAYGIASDHHGSLMLAGRFTGSVAFDSTPLNSKGGGDGFVAKISQAPVFKILPEGQTVVPGSDVTLSGSALGALPLSYQWYFNETLPIPDANDPTLLLTQVDFDRKGLYTLEASNLQGRALSPPVFLNVFGLPRPKVSIDGLPGTQFDLTNTASARVTLTHELSGIAIYYTLDGSVPSAGSTRYSGPFDVSQSTTLRAIGYDSAFTSSQTAPVPFRFYLTPPLIQINGIIATHFSFTNVDVLNVTLVSPLLSATVRYSVTGFPLDTNALGYRSPFVMTQSFVLYAEASAIGMTSGYVGPVSVKMIRLYPLEISPFVDGSLSLSPPGGLYQAGTEVQLDAQPAPGWSFMKWMGDVAGDRAQTSVKMDRPRTIGATFGTMVSTTSVGSGSIQLTPQAPLYPRGSVIRATAIPSDKSYFALWGGVGSGVTNPLAFTVNGPVPTLSALFSLLGPDLYSLTVISEGRGTARWSPVELFYPKGARVQLIGIPEVEDSLVLWEGSVLSTSNPLTIEMVTNRVVRARFSDGAAAVLISPFWKEDHFTFQFRGPTGLIYRVESSGDLVKWKAVQTFTNLLGRREIIYQTPEVGTRFFRALSQ